MHGVSIVVSSLPSVRGNLSAQVFREEAVQHELRQWTSGLRKVGLALTTAELQALAIDVGLTYSGVRDVLVRPFAPYHKHVGTGQTWNLFTSAHRLPSRLEIDLEEKGVWRTIYRARSFEHGWRRDQLDDVRLRKAVYLMSWKRGYHVYKTFSAWVAREAAKDFPSATRVRVRYWRYETPAPDAVRRGEEPEGRYLNTRVLELGGLR